MSAVARSCWPKDSSFLKEKWKDSLQRQKVKTLFHTKDMRGSTLVWCHKQGLPDTSSVLSTLVPLPDGTNLSVQAYFVAINRGLDDTETRWERTTQFITQWKRAWKPTHGGAEATMQSYLRQEYEGVSLAVKIHTANCLKRMGVKPINLQHDGLVLNTGRVSPEKLGLSLLTSAPAPLDTHN